MTTFLKKSFGLLFLSLFSLGTAFCQTEKSKSLLSFEDAVSLALEYNLNIKTFRNNTKIADNNEAIGNAGFYPKVDASGSFNYQKGTVQNPNFGKLENESMSTSTGINLTYTLFDGLSNVNTYRKLKNEKDLASVTERFDIENVLTQLASAYYQLYTAASNFDIAKEGLKISQERVARAEARFEFGNDTKVAVLQAQVDLSNDSLTLLDAKRQYDELKHNLNIFLGRSATVDFEISMEIPGFKKLERLSLREQTLAENAQYLQSLRQLKISKLDRKIINSTKMPRLDFNTGYNWNQVADSFDVEFDDPSGNYSGGLTLSYNIFDGNQQRIRRKNARIQVMNDELQVANTLLQIERDLENAWTVYQNNLYKLKVQRNNLAVTEINFEQVKERYNLGQLTATDFREAQLNLLKARSNLVTAQSEAKLAEVELLRLSGQLVKVQ
ncbi:membrane protein [Fulvitalea axinellae]|uniref:Membrane protein n=1 Tax=Fulvitalea axinellae TaxID=1182444 RepID=A0AAU9DDC2_9BACT|nr:membrane protein [Fulvitalea axinellae]